MSFYPRIVSFSIFAVGLVIIGDAYAQQSSPSLATSGGGVLSTLMICGFMGLIGQGARVIVGMKTFADYKTSDPVDSGSVFNLARLVFSLIVGFVAGVVAGLADWAANSTIDKVAVDTFADVIRFAAAGYIGTDVIEAFTTKFFEPPSDGSTTKAPPDSELSPENAGLGQKIDSLSLQLADVHSTVATIASQPQGSVPGADYPAWALARDMKIARSKYWSSIKEAADTYDLPVSIIGAIGSKESHWGLALKPIGPGGTGDWTKRDPKKWKVAMPSDGLGWGRGLMQIDWFSHDFAKTGNWSDPHANIMFGCNLLAGFVKREQDGGKDANTALKCGVSDYNGMSGPTSSYSLDVIARANWIVQQGLDRDP